MTIFKSSLVPRFRWLIKEKHRQPSGKDWRCKCMC